MFICPFYCSEPLEIRGEDSVHGGMQTVGEKVKYQAAPSAPSSNEGRPYSKQEGKLKAGEGTGRKTSNLPA